MIHHDSESNNNQSVVEYLAAKRLRTASAVLAARSLKYPTINPFVRGFQKDRTPRESWTVDTYKAAEARADALERQNCELSREQRPKLELAQDTHLKEKHLPGRHVDDELKRVAEIYIARFGVLNNRLIREICNDHPAINASNYGAHRNFLRDYQADVQFQTLAYFRLNMQTLVENSGGVAAWENASTEQRKGIIVHCFSKSPLSCSKLAFHFENNAVDFENIWAGDDEVRGKWQTFFRSIFVALALEVFERHTRHTGRSEADKRSLQKPLFLFYKAVKRSRGIIDLQMGNVGQVPSRPSRHEDDSRSLLFSEVPDISIIS